MVPLLTAAESIVQCVVGGLAVLDDVEGVDELDGPTLVDMTGTAVTGNTFVTFTIQSMYELIRVNALGVDEPFLQLPIKLS